MYYYPRLMYSAETPERKLAKTTAKTLPSWARFTAERVQRSQVQSVDFANSLWIVVYVCVFENHSFKKLL